MPCVFLSDEELVEMLLERPHVIVKMIEKLQHDLAEEQETTSYLYKRNAELRKEQK